MKKLATAAIAAAAGTALVAGGVGTFALWNASATVPAQHFTAGSLALAADSAGTWTDKNGNVISPASFRMVPGDVLTYTQNLTVTAVGDNIAADLTFTPPTASGGLNTFVSVGNLTVTSGGSTVNSGTTGAKLHFVKGTSSVAASIQVTFNDTTDNSSMNQVLDLSTASFTLAQVAS